jgi:hypothetical protein
VSVRDVTVDGSREDDVAARLLVGFLPVEVLDSLVAEASASGDLVAGVDDLLGRLTAAVLERALGAEMTEHLGYEHSDVAGHGSGNSRNGYSPKTVATQHGPVTIRIPRDRNSSFEPRILQRDHLGIRQLARAACVGERYVDQGSIRAFETAATRHPAASVGLPAP